MGREPDQRLHVLLNMYRWFSAFLIATLLAAACSASERGTGQQRLFIIGQDLGSVRDYYASDCCPAADGNTAYLSLYSLLSEEAGFGGLGIDPDGNPVSDEFDWGGGPANAWKSATGFEGGLAVGLSITENDHPGALDSLVKGDYDDNIRQLARFIKMVEEPVWLRIGYEFDGAWNEGYGDADRYVTAWRRIVDGLRAAGAANAEFVWQAAVFPLDELTEGYHENLPDWYPGDDYVDWAGISLFLRLDERPGIEVAEHPPTARELISELLDFARSRGKPVMIAEASPQGYDLARGTQANISFMWDGPQGKGIRDVSPVEIWEEWYAPLFELMNDNRDVIYALAYINCNWDVQDMWNAPYESGYWGDSRLQASPLIANRFSEAIDRWRAKP